MLRKSSPDALLNAEPSLIAKNPATKLMAPPSRNQSLISGAQSVAKMESTSGSRNLYAQLGPGSANSLEEWAERCIGRCTHGVKSSLECRQKQSVGHRNDDAREEWHG